MFINLVSNLALPVPAGILSGLLSVTPEWLSLAATLVSEAVPIEAGGTLDDDGLEVDVLSLVELDEERFITLDTDFFAAAALLVCCFPFNFGVCFTDTDFVCDDDALAEDAV